MSMPGEIPQEIGRAYAQVLSGCLERTIKHFEIIFTVENEPEKLSFRSPVGGSFSFDRCGIFRHPVDSKEVFLELKGHSDGAKVLDGYKDFLVKAYAVSLLYPRHREDFYWFATNVPFGSSIGRSLTSSEYISSILIEGQAQRTSKILGDLEVDYNEIDSLSGRVSVCVLTDSYMRLAGAFHRVKHGETVWSITKLLHGGHIPLRFFEPIERVVTALNDLESADKIKAGKRLLMPWYGLNWQYQAPDQE